jgi:dTDP-4-amino-4,6-dideoxygalactose transaminase/predicted GNAT family N-acyltransferase
MSEKIIPIPLFKVNMNNNLEIVMNTLTSGMITQGSKVEEFENKLKEYFNYPYILTLNSATSGLTLAYRLLNLNNDDVVISTPLTCFATNAAILANNLNIIWADTDPNTCNIDLEDVKNKINENTKVLTFVHWGGVPVNLDIVEELKIYTKNTYGHDLYIVEDCAHSFGCEFNGKKLGTYGNICVFSLQAIKHLTSGDGGLLFLPNEEMYKRAKLLRWFGIDRERRSLPGNDFRLEPDISEYGYKFHMNDINASIGLANIINIQENIDKCYNNGQYYNENLKNIESIELFNYDKNTKPSYWIYTLKILNGRKNEFIEYMKNKNIVTSQVHARNDKHSCLQSALYKDELKNLDIIETQIVSIPVGWWLSIDELNYIVNTIKEFANIPYITKLDIKDIEEYREILYQMNEYKKDTYNMNIDSIHVLKIGDKILSTAKLFIENKIYESVGHIEDVVTRKEYRGKGYGKQIIKYLLNIGLNKNKCYKIVLNCKTDLDDFYTKCGMVKTGSSFEYTKP